MKVKIKGIEQDMSLEEARRLKEDPSIDSNSYYYFSGGWKRLSTLDEPTEEGKNKPTYYGDAASEYQSTTQFEMNGNILGWIFAIVGTGLLFYLTKTSGGFVGGIIGFVLFYPLGRLVYHIIERTREDVSCIDLKIFSLAIAAMSCLFPPVFGILGLCLSFFYIFKNMMKYGAFILLITGISSIAGGYVWLSILNGEQLIY